VQPEPRLGRGDRLPDIAAFLADGSEFVLSVDAGGLPVVVVVGSLPVDDLLADPPGAVVHVPLGGPPVDGRISIHDDGRAAIALTGGSPGVLVAGPDHRVLAVGSLDDLDDLLALLRPVVDGDRPVRRKAVPLLIVDDVVDAALRHDLLDAAGGWRPSPVVRPDAHGQPSLVTDLDAKARFDRVLEGELATQVVGAVERRLLPEVRRGFAHAPRSFEAVKLVRYEAGLGWFAVHRDNATPDAAHRRLAVTINLDDGYEGGDLTFPELGPDLYRPRPGAAIVFSCGLLHEVTPVRTGTRHALVTFLW
jgi:hypothetical protein